MKRSREGWYGLALFALLVGVAVNPAVQPTQYEFTAEQSRELGYEATVWELEQYPDGIEAYYEQRLEQLLADIESDRLEREEALSNLPQQPQRGFKTR